MTNKSTTIVLLALIALILLSTARSQTGAVDTDPILDYYWQQALRAADGYSPNVAGVAYTLTARSYYHGVGDEGRITRTDSALQVFFVTDGLVDSVVTEQGDAGKFEAVRPFWPSIFEMDFHRTLFPNDTGGVFLPIALMADSSDPARPDGLVIIDRYEYYPRSLYLYYPQKGGFKRYTRSLKFQVVDGLVFPDSIWVVATKLGVFFTESYRLETDVVDVDVLSGKD